MEYIKILLYGVIIGLSCIVPGMSGGTMAVALNVFDRLIKALGEFRKDIKGNALFLLMILTGAGSAILIFSNSINFLLEYHYMATNFFFVGIILGSIPLVYKKATQDGFKPFHLIPCAITFAIMLVTVFCAPSVTQTIDTVLTVPVFIKLFLVSAIAAVCMIIPGISGSFVMLLFGVFETIMSAVSMSGFNFPILIPVALGAGIGIIVGSKFIDELLKRFPQATYFAILGFMFGSIPAVLDKVAEGNKFTGGIELLIGVVVLVVGFAISFIFTNDKVRKAIFHKKAKKIS